MLQVSVELKGPIPEGTAPALIDQALQRSVQQLLQFGEQRLNKMLQMRPAGVYLSAAQAGKQHSTGNYRRHLHTVQVGPHEAMIGDGGVIYGPWLEGTGSRNQSTRFKGYAAFRRTTQWLNTKADRVLLAELKKVGL